MKLLKNNTENYNEFEQKFKYNANKYSFTQQIHSILNKNSGKKTQ